VLFIVACVLTLIPADMFPGAILTGVVGLALGGFLTGREHLRPKVKSALP
jgi:hypothetical protein